MIKKISCFIILLSFVISATAQTKKDSSFRQCRCSRISFKPAPQPADADAGVFTGITTIVD